jgi:hypothetical protein
MLSPRSSVRIQFLVADVANEPGTPIAVWALVEFLRRIQKSIRLWNKEGGRKGYLDFVSSQYVK